MNKSLLIKLCVITGLIMILEISGLALGVSGQMNSKIFTSLQMAELPAHFVLEILAFIATVIALHLLVIIYVWLFANALQRMMNITQKTAERAGIMILLLSWTAIFLLNNTLFNRSLFAYWGTFELGPLNEHTLAILFALLAALPIVIILWRTLSATTARMAFTAACCGVIVIPVTMVNNRPAPAVHGSDQPNIIVIGIDSFRPEYLTAKALMPNLTRLLDESAVFPEVYTPIARTFPSWTSMLSGLHPLETGARMNLVEPANVRRDTMLTWPLREAGYHNILATDERRFSNLDESYGFDTVIGPATGASDFTLGLFGDLPLTNLVAYSRLGKIVFPHLHNNRAVSRLYQPENFIKQLDRALPRNQAQPIFLATHLCLPHWPFNWSTAPTSAQIVSQLEDSLEPITHDTIQRQQYESTLPHVDRQISGLLDSLRDAGYLENAIVVLLSDHGETFGSPEETLVDIEDPNIPLTAKRLNGHGTSVLTLLQHQTFIALKRFGGAPFITGVRPQRFHNYDLTPTLLELIDLPSSSAMRGISMVPWINDRHRDGLDRPLFLETGFTIPAANKPAINITDAISEGIGYYNINDSAKLVIDPLAMTSLLNHKQRGVLRGSQLLAQIPSTTHAGTLQLDWILADTVSNSAIKLTSDNISTHCQLGCADMFAELLEFYGSEIVPHAMWSSLTGYSLGDSDTASTLL